MRSSVLFGALIASVSAEFLAATTGSGVHVPGFAPTNPFEPLQQRLTYGSSSDQMIVAWNTYAELQNATVKFGLKPSALNSIAYTQGSSLTYPTSRTYNNFVTISGLAPNTKYYYKVEYSNCQGCAYLPTYSFSTARTVGDMTPFKVAVVVDMGLFGPEGLTTTAGPSVATQNLLPPNASNTIQSVLEQLDEYDFVAHAGDLAYADYALKESFSGFLGTGLSTTQPNMSQIANVYETLLESFYDQLTPITAYKPYMVSPGNHEANCDNGGTKNKATNMTYTEASCTPGQTNFTGYRAHWSGTPSTNSLDALWYSYNHGMAHFISLDSETDLDYPGNSTNYGPDEGPANNGFNDGPFGVPQQQYDWLLNDLKTVDRRLTPWVIVFSHRPWYVQSGSNGAIPAGAAPSRAAFEGLFNSYGVDLVINGHAHFVQINSPMNASGIADPKGLNDPTAPWYIVNGAAGHYDGLDPLSLPLQPYVMYAEDTVYAWSRLSFLNATNLMHEVVASNNGSVLRTDVLYKSHQTDSKGGLLGSIKLGLLGL